MIGVETGMGRPSAFTRWNVWQQPHVVYSFLLPWMVESTTDFSSLIVYYIFFYNWVPVPCQMYLLFHALTSWSLLQGGRNGSLIPPTGCGKTWQNRYLTTCKKMTSTTMNVVVCIILTSIFRCQGQKPCQTRHIIGLLIHYTIRFTLKKMGLNKL